MSGVEIFGVAIGALILVAIVRNAFGQRKHMDSDDSGGWAGASGDTDNSCDGGGD